MRMLFRAHFLFALIAALVGLAQGAFAQFVHPGSLNTASDFDRMKAKIAANEQPWKGSYDKMIAMNHAQLTWNWAPVTQIIRGASPNNYARSQQDALAIYLNALRYRLTGDTAYADKAIQGMDAWSGTMTSAPGGDINAYLASGICGWEFAVAGETLRGYSGWSQASIDAYKSFLLLFGDMAENFVVNHAGNNGSIYRTNWDSANLATMAAVAVFCDDTTRFDKALAIFRGTGTGNGNIFNGAWYLHPQGWAQAEESGRDQAHCLGGFGDFVILSEIAWNQGVDLYGFDNNRLLKALEYICRYNVFNDDLPYEPFFGGVWPFIYTEPALSTQTRGNLVPYLEIAYGHYAGRKGLAATFLGQAAAVLRPSGDIGNWNSPDYFGFDSLTHYRHLNATDVAPAGVIGTVKANTVTLQWSGAVRATSYNVKRAAVSGGPYTTIGTATPANLFYTDTTAAPQTPCYYVVSAVTPAGETADSAEAKVQTLDTRYTFEGNASDVAGTRNATLVNGPTFTAGYGGGQAVNLDGTDDYVALPAGSATQQDITISARVYWRGGGNWQRIFDFGTPNQQRSMFLTPSNGSKARFSINTGYKTIVLDGPVLAANTWVHVAVSLKAGAGTLYVNGVPVASQPMTASPMFGQPACYIGKSQYADPGFNGLVDDFRIHNYGLSGAEVYALAGLGGSNAAPVFTSQAIGRIATEDTNIGTTGQTLAGSATDANGGTLTYSKISGPSWLTVASNGALLGTPVNANVGENLFVVRVIDSAGASDDANLSIIVANTNDAPVWSSASLTRPALTRDQPYYAGVSLAADASDVDAAYGDTLSFSKISGPAWLSIAANGTLSGTPGAADAGTNSFTVRIVDSVGAFADATLTIVVYPFHQRAGLALEDNLADTLGNYPATAAGSPAFGIGRIGRGLVFDGVDDLLTLPAGIADSQDITVAAWVYWNGGGANQRIFDFGNGTGQYLFLTPSNGSNLRFAIKNGGAEQQLLANALPTGQWVHTAVTLSGDIGRLYVNGALVVTNTGMTINPSDFRPAVNFLGDSQWAADPLFSGRMDDFRVYNYALSASDIAALIDLVPAVPITLTATPRAGRIDLTWGVSQGAQTYSVKRALVSGGPYTVVASGLATAACADTAVVNGTPYYYVVTALNARGESGNSPEAVATPSDLLVHIKFDENTGATAVDSTGNGWNATLVNSPAWTSGHLGYGVSLPATASQYLAFPAGIVSGLADFTISTWVRINAFATWQRIFDFGTGQTNYMFLTTQYTGTSPNNARLRFGIRANSAAEQSVSGTSIALPSGTWVHVAVIRSGTTVSLQVNGSLAGSGTIAPSPSALGATTLNYLGKSQFGTDPYLNASLDDFRIYTRALTSAEIQALVAGIPAPPAGLTATAGDGQIALNWSPSGGATRYNLKRSTAAGGPYTTLPVTLTGTSHTDTGLNNGTTCYYVVSALNFSGESGPSAEASATPLSAYQQWKLSHGLSLSLADTATPDGDGIPILLKYATGMTPGSPAATSPVVPAIVDNALTLRFTRLSPAPVGYTVEACTDLSTWTTIATLPAGSDTWTGPAAVAETGTGETRVSTVTDAQAADSSPGRFLRLRVAPAP